MYPRIFPGPSVARSKVRVNSRDDGVLPSALDSSTLVYNICKHAELLLFGNVRIAVDGNSGFSVYNECYIYRPRESFWARVSATFQSAISATISTEASRTSSAEDQPCLRRK